MPALYPAPSGLPHTLGATLEKGEAQRATVRRDAAMAALDQWMRAFVTIARIALADDRQRLEQLGILARN